MSYLPEQSSNPIFQNKDFKTRSLSAQDQMTLEGTLNKGAISFVLLLAAAYFSWTNPNPLYIMVGGILGFIMALVTVFKKSWSPVTVPLYSILEGLALGGISLSFETRYPGIASAAVCITFAVLGLMLGAYRLEWVRATPKFRKGVMIATLGVCLVYFVNLIMSFWGPGLSIISSSSPMGIGFSLLVVGIAAFNLILDFDFIEQSSKRGLPKYMEWFAAFGLMVTLIWLYLEILRLLAKLRDRK